MRDRFVVLGLGRPRSTWFGDVTRWANSASLPLEFVKCVSAEEAIAADVPLADAQGGLCSHQGD